MAEKILEIKNLTVQYRSEGQVTEAVNGISLQMEEGESLGLVGETGAGKTTTALSVMQLLPEVNARINSGEILYRGEDVIRMSAAKKREYRGNLISMIFQDPMTALNPVKNVGSQIMEVLRLHRKLNRAEAIRQAQDMLEMVGIPVNRFYDYPNQFSGGMKQRVVIAIALACRPSLLIADEPTTALDVTIQAQVLELIRRLKEENHTSLLLITHDLGVIAENCERVAVMYAGEIVEYGTVEDIFLRTAHPYTEGLFGSIPNLRRKVHRLNPIPGLAPDPTALPPGCKFAPRCRYASPECSAAEIPVTETNQGHQVKCIHCLARGGQSA